MTLIRHWWKQTLLALMGAGIVYLGWITPNIWVGFPAGSRNQILLIAIGVLVMTIAILGDRFPTKKLSNGYQTTLVIIVNCFLFIYSIELIAAISINLIATLVYNGQILDAGYDARRDYDYYQNAEWGPKHWEEAHQLPREYRPYIIWQYKQFAGTTIQINEDYTRNTPNAECHVDSLKVFALGGSGMWGAGAPDWETIPAYLQNKLSEVSEGAICVMNYGQPAFVSTQEMILLILEIQKGNVPDIVIFYDGPNDVVATLQTGAGAHQNVPQIANRIQGSQGNFITDTINSMTYTQRFLNAFIESRSDTIEDADDTEVENANLAKQLLSAYESNIEMVSLLGERYDFEVYFFWQPHISGGNKPLIPLEQDHVKNVDPVLQRLYEETYSLLGERTDMSEQFYDLTDAFDAVERFIWIDDVHIVPEGNEIIAERMFEVLQNSPKLNS